MEIEMNIEQQETFYGKTFADLLAKWDRGDSIWSLEMGGLGPGYEQAIQIAAVEMGREGMDVPLEGPKEGHNAIWEEVCDRALKKHNEALGGLSGAQYGAAKWLSWKWVHGGGPLALVNELKKRGEDERLIQVSKAFPRVAA
jgi:hypothetical protein